MNDMDGCLGLNFLALKKELLERKLIKKDDENIDVVYAIIEYGDTDKNLSQDFAFRFGYLQGAADCCDMTIGEMIDDLNWEKVKQAQKAQQQPSGSLTRMADALGYDGRLPDGGLAKAERAEKKLIKADKLKKKR